MIISKKQIMHLIEIAKDCVNHRCYLHTKYAEKVAKLLEEIGSQQPEELKEIE